jgi:dTDP-4-amino-4,6-dideoxygalactose transaminase
MSDLPKNIPMVDLVNQHQRLKPEIDAAISDVISKSDFIKGEALQEFENNLANYLGAKFVIGVANGTDALQISLMALGLKPGDEVIVPAFTYVSTAEVIALLGLTPVMVDVDVQDFCIDISSIKNALTNKTKAIIPVHLYGQSARMEEIVAFANEHRLFIIEDNAQSLGANYYFSDGTKKKTGTIGHIGCTSFFPSKNLGCFGDGGAIITNDERLAKKIKMIANHGQSKKYFHDVLGVNSRLDTIQAAVLNVKLKYLDEFSDRRKNIADIYDVKLSIAPDVVVPHRRQDSSHVFHQYTIQVKKNLRDGLKDFLHSKGVPSMIYYPLPLYQQKAFSSFFNGEPLQNTETLCQEVLSLPIHTEMTDEVQDYIFTQISRYFAEIYYY